MTRAVYGATILLSAFLLFAVQPMVGRALLPRLGGVPGVWTACLLFFQAALLAGYGYVWLTARASPRLRVLVHLAALALPLTVLAPFAYATGPLGLSPAERPVAYALAFLALNVGLPFTLLSATAPLLSDWYARVRGERPYFLYAASNAGSLGALLAYPFLIEPFVALEGQALGFRVGLGVLAAGLLAVSVGVWRRGGEAGWPALDRVGPGAGTDAVTDTDTDTDADADADTDTDADAETDADTDTDTDSLPDPATAPLTWRRRATWVGLAFVPSTLLAGATAYVSTDLAPVPLLWVVPLALYLLSFILAFSERVAAPPPIVGRAACLTAVMLVVITVTHGNEPVWLLVALHLFFLGAGGWIAHRRLAEDAPHPRHLPEFFVWVAVGGVAGTLVVAVLAPLLLSDLWEYPVAIALACAARDRTGVVVRDRPLRTDLPHAAVAGLLVAAGGWLVPLVLPLVGVEDSEVALRTAVFLSLGPASIYAYRWMPLRRRYSICLLAIVAAGALTQERGERRLSTRSFFGVLRVVDQGGERHLLHGTTLHGSQRLRERGACVPMTYYVREGPLGSAFAAHRARGRRGRTVAVGLGTGAAACFAETREPWRFIEINPDVIEVARDPRWFTFLANSPSGEVEVSLGDGRIGLGEERDGSLALIFVDAFNSDAVPVHLLTREAIRLYVDKLSAGGWAVLHVSNRVLALDRVVGDVVAAEGLAARLARDDTAMCVVVARRPEDLDGLPPERWRPLAGDPARAWSDAASSLWTALRSN